MFWGVFGFQWFFEKFCSNLTAKIHRITLFITFLFHFSGFDPLMPEIDYTNDYTNDFYNYDDELLESLPLEKGCDNHATTVSTLTYFYPSALGQPLWTPECQAENPSLYKSVQCRRKENSKDHACWCVNHKSGNPTIHMDWAATDIDEKMCEDLAFEYGYGSKRKIA